MDFVCRLVNFIPHWANWLVKVLGEFFLGNEFNSLYLQGEFFGLVKLTSGLENPGYSLPEGQAGNLTVLW